MGGRSGRRRYCSQLISSPLSNSHPATINLSYIEEVNVCRKSTLVVPGKSARPIRMENCADRLSRWPLTFDALYDETYIGAESICIKEKSDEVVFPPDLLKPCSVQVGARPGKREGDAFLTG